MLPDLAQLGGTGSSVKAPPPALTYFNKHTKQSRLLLSLICLIQQYETNLTISKVLTNPCGSVQLVHSCSALNELRQSDVLCLIIPHKLYVQIPSIQLFLLFSCLTSLSGESISEHERRPNPGSTELVKKNQKKKKPCSKKQTSSPRTLRYSTGHSGKEPTMLSKSFLNLEMKPGWLVKHLKWLLSLEI